MQILHKLETLITICDSLEIKTSHKDFNDFNVGVGNASSLLENTLNDVEFVKSFHTCSELSELTSKFDEPRPSLVEF